MDPDIELELFGKALRQLRGEKGQREVAFVAGVSVETWSGWEEGVKRPRLEQVSKALASLGTTPASLAEALILVACPPEQPTSAQEQPTSAQEQPEQPTSARAASQSVLRSVVGILAQVQALLVESSQRLGVPSPSTPWPGLNCERTDDEVMAAVVLLGDLGAFFDTLVEFCPRLHQPIATAKATIQELLASLRDCSPACKTPTMRHQTSTDSTRNPA